MDSRLQQLKLWICQQPGLQACTLAPVSGDASFRRYFRASQGERSWIAMDAPPEKENCRPFIAIAQHWHSHGIAVPAIVAQDLAQGFLLLDDLGDRLYLPELTAESADQLYGAALDTLLQLQTLPAAVDYTLPAYDAALLDREMALFRDWLTRDKLQIELSAAENTLLDTTFSLLRASALAQPQVTVHRDYHSRNLMITPEGKTGVLDFQDAVTGPITYDPVSLLKDCYIKWPASQVTGWCEHFRQRSLALDLHQAGPDEFALWFNRMGMQRHLKAAGIFARLSLRDGKHGYLQDIPRTIGYLVEAAATDPELAEFHAWLQQRFLPAMQAHLLPSVAETAP